ncbi:hypothetical protein CBR_g28763 [Chara braunii]|uniref:Uncharacterized protein n=1 Tax=Chara braunii TaxID=69332 RepID=A0A388L9R2_CHABU|nr:hypothetical protein CBR_g28763 [Chara braunii]|eukprot:GBG79049.1 hypothetical protein CBR_g28763 [Chara braunii]
MPKSKRLQVDEASSENDDDFQSEEVAVVDTQGTPGSQQLGFGQNGVLRDQLAATRQVAIGAAARAWPRTHKAQGLVITKALVQRQAMGADEVTTSRVRATIVPVAGGGRVNKAVIGTVHSRHEHPAQRAGGSSVVITPPLQKKVDAVCSRTTMGDHHTSASRVAEGVVKGGVDDVRRDGRRDGQREGDDDNDRPVASWRKRTAEEFNLEERSKLDVGAEPQSMVIMPPNDVPLFKIDDPAQREPPLHRARVVENW